VKGFGHMMIAFSVLHSLTGTVRLCDIDVVLNQI